MGDFSTDILTKNTIGYLDNLVKDLIKATESISRNYITESKRLTAKENIQFSLEKYYDTIRQDREEVQTQAMVAVKPAPEYEVLPPPPQAEAPMEDDEERQRRESEGLLLPPPIIPGGPSQYTPDGSNGRLAKEQLTSVGTLAGSPEGGPYWYGRTAYLRPDAAQAFLKAKADANKAGVQLIINSAYRSLEHQQALQGKYAVVAPVGTSPHGAGIALDIEFGPGHEWFKKNGMKYGWKWMAIPNDDVHFEYVGGGQSTAQPQKKNNKIPEQVSSSGTGRQLIAVVNNQNQPMSSVQSTPDITPTSLNKNYSNFSEILLTHTTFNVG